MVFGDIVEPSTRALLIDDFEEYPEYVEPEILWEGNCTVPPDLTTLIFIEGNKIIKLFNAFSLNTQTLYCKLQSEDIQIYKSTNNTYIVSYIKKSLMTGEIIELLSEWLKKAHSIFAITSETLATYQNINLTEKPETLIRKLSTQSTEGFSYPKLEPPNLVSGLGADVLTYSIYTGFNSTLFIVYLDNLPLDSVNINPVVNLMNLLNLPVEQSVSNLNPEPSNLYL